MIVYIHCKYSTVYLCYQVYHIPHTYPDHHSTLNVYEYTILSNWIVSLLQISFFDGILFCALAMIVVDIVYCKNMMINSRHIQAISYHCRRHLIYHMIHISFCWLYSSFLSGVAKMCRPNNTSSLLLLCYRLIAKLFFPLFIILDSSKAQPLFFAVFYQ